jgi:hypothetical protein
MSSATPPVGGPPQIPSHLNLGDSDQPSPALKQAMDAFWSLFNTFYPNGTGHFMPPNYSDFSSPNAMEIHWLNMVSPIVNNLMAQFTAQFGAGGPDPTKDPAAFSVYNLIALTPFKTSSGFNSLEGVCAETEPTRTKDLLQGLTETSLATIFNNLDNGSGSCALGNWYNSFHFETPKPSDTIWSNFEILQGTLGNLANNPTSANWDAVCNAILGLNSALASPPDGFSLFLQTYVEANFTLATGATQQSLVSLATAIEGTTGGAAKDPTDVAALQALLFPSLPSKGGGAGADLLQSGWVGAIMQIFEDPYNPPS